MSRWGATWRPGLVLAVLLSLPLVAVASGLVTLRSCLPATGSWAQTAVRLAVLRPDEACPPGTLAVGAPADRALTVLVAVALPVLLAHLVVLTGAGGVVGAVRAVVVAMGRRLLGRVPTPSPGLPVPAAVPAWPSVRLPGATPPFRLPPDRGPPRLPALG